MSHVGSTLPSPARPISGHPPVYGYNDTNKFKFGVWEWGESERGEGRGGEGRGEREGGKGRGGDGACITAELHAATAML